jgi:hypothetical protein
VWDSRRCVVHDTWPSRVLSETPGVELRAGVGGVGDAAVLVLNTSWAGGGGRGVDDTAILALNARPARCLGDTRSNAREAGKDVGVGRG